MKLGPLQIFRARFYVGQTDARIMVRWGLRGGFYPALLPKMLVWAWWRFRFTWRFGSSGTYEVDE